MIEYEIVKLADIRADDVVLHLSYGILREFTVRNVFDDHVEYMNEDFFICEVDDGMFWMKKASPRLPEKLGSVVTVDPYKYIRVHSENDNPGGSNWYSVRADCTISSSTVLNVLKKGSK